MGNRVKWKVQSRTSAGGGSAVIHTAGKFHRTCGNPMLNRSVDTLSVPSRAGKNTGRFGMRMIATWAPCVDDVALLLSTHGFGKTVE